MSNSSANSVDSPFKIHLKLALPRWFSWLEHNPMHQRVAGLIPCWGTYGKQPIIVSLSYWCLSLSLSQINLKKHILRWRLNIYKVFPEGIHPCNMNNWDIYWRRYKKHCIEDNDASVPFKVGTLGPHTVLPIAISFLVFPWISSTVWNLFLFKGDFSFEKSQGAKSGL